MMDKPYIDELIERCQSVISGKTRAESEWKSLRDEIVGAFNQGQYAHIGFEASYYHWGEVYGGLRLYKDDMARKVEMARARAQSTNVSATASAVAEVSLDIAISQAVNAIMIIEGLTPEDKSHAANLLNDAGAENEAGKKAEKIVDALKWAIEKGGPSLAAMAPVLGQMLQGLGI